MNFLQRFLLLIFVLSIFMSCHKSPSELTAPLFELIAPEQSNIFFSNYITDKKECNIIRDVNFYSGGGVAIEDINNDGLPDIYLTGNQTGDRLYLNKGNLRFTDITQSAGIVNDSVWSNGVTMADINGDGYLDIYICKKASSNILYVNNGDLTFTNRAKEWGG